jgi:chromosome segregation ATPase
VAYLKQQVSAANKERDEFERVCKIERDLKDQYVKRADIAEKKYTEAQHEVAQHRKKTEQYEDEASRLRRRIYNLENEKEETSDQKNLELAKLQRRLEQVNKERESLKWALSEYQKYINSVM